MGKNSYSTVGFCSTDLLVSHGYRLKSYRLMLFLRQLRDFLENLVDFALQEVDLFFPQAHRVIEREEGRRAGLDLAEQIHAI